MPASNADFSKKNISGYFWRWSVSAIVIVLAVLLSYAGYQHATGNLHVVIPNEVIRSASLTPAQLQKTITNYHLKSIINLAPHEANYRAELKISELERIKHFTLPMYAHGLPPVETLKQLTQLIDVAPRPVLIHCRQGADRTGLAAAIALILTSDTAPDMIYKQYSLLYGAISPTSIGKSVMHYYFLWLQKNNLMSTSQNFLAWLEQLKVGTDYPYHPANYHN